MTEIEKLWFWFWRRIGELMRNRELPDDYVEFESYSRAYEAKHFRFTAANQRVALATREMFAGWFPPLLRPLVRRSIDGLLDPPLLAAFGLRPAPPWLVWTTERAMRARALDWSSKRKRPKLRTRISRAHYPQGYRIESLGPPPFDK